CILSYILQHSIPTHFPYTTLFRSRVPRDGRRLKDEQTGLLDRPIFAMGNGEPVFETGALLPFPFKQSPKTVRLGIHIAQFGRHRSEEHTSELQSRENLVCRLLLEK